MRRSIVSGAALALVAALLAGCAHGPRKVPSEAVLYKRAKDALTVENWRQAEARYRQLLSTYPFGKYATQSRLDLIYAYYRANDPDEAAKQADEFAKENPASPYVDYALFLKGVAYANAMQRGPVDALFHVSLRGRDPLDQQEAYSAFKQLITQYPHSRYAQKARRWMVFVRDRLAGFNLQVARFYARRGNWVAAVNRAATVVTQFSTTPSVKPALHIMVRGYRALGEKHLAEVTQAWYRHNFVHKPNNG